VGVDTFDDLPKQEEFGYEAFHRQTTRKETSSVENDGCTRSMDFDNVLLCSQMGD
jgi:hypothetical protein